VLSLSSKEEQADSEPNATYLRVGSSAQSSQFSYEPEWPQGLGGKELFLDKNLLNHLTFSTAAELFYQEHAISFGSSHLAARKVKLVTWCALEDSWKIHNFYHKVAKWASLVR
jgi:hypothetical protein